MGVKTKPPRDLGPGSWVCDNCGFNNRPQNWQCGGGGGRMGCKAPRPDDGFFGMSDDGGFQADSWDMGKGTGKGSWDGPYGNPFMPSLKGWGKGGKGGKRPDWN